MLNLFVVIGAGFSDNDVVRFYVVYGEAFVVEGVDKAGLSDDVYARARMLVCQEACGGQSGSHKIVLADFYSHVRKALTELPGRSCATVC